MFKYVPVEIVNRDRSQSENSAFSRTYCRMEYRPKVGQVLALGQTSLTKSKYKITLLWANQLFRSGVGIMVVNAMASKHS